MPIGFARIRFAGRNVLCQALVDSGNLFGPCISLDLAKKLNVKINKKIKKIGTADRSSQVTVLGRVSSPIKIYIEGIALAVAIRPYVMEKLSHPMNLGQDFLRKNNADLIFREKYVILKLRQGTTKLYAKSRTIGAPSIDQRVKHVLDLWTQHGRNPFSSEILALPRQYSKSPPANSKSSLKEDINIELLTVKNTRNKLFTQSLEQLEPNSSRLVTIRSKTHSTNQLDPNIVWFYTHNKRKLWDNKKLTISEGLYNRKSRDISVLMCNHSARTQVLEPHTLIGFSNEVVTGETEIININCVVDKSEPPEERDLSKLNGQQRKEWQDFIVQQLNIDNNVILNKNPALKKRVIVAFMRNLPAIARNGHDFGSTQLSQMHITIKPGVRPVRAKVRPLNPIQEKDLKRQISDWLQAGVIEESNATWSSALVPVVKKGSTELRWCVDYRALNAATEKDSYPLPNIQVNLNKLSGSKVFSTWDARGAYHQIKLSPESRDYTTFVSPFGLHRFIRVPFGLTNAGQTYSRMVSHAISLSHNQNHSMSYLDDVITHSDDNEKHVIHVERILEMHSRYGLKLNLKKCQIFQAQVQYLGHNVSKDGITMLDSHVKRVLDWPLPETGKKLQQFLGFVNYYSSFIKEYGPLVATLNSMRNIKGSLDWTEELKDNFKQLKKAFAKSPMRAYPDYSEGASPFVLDTDFSALCVGAVLSQKQNGVERFIACASSKNSPAQAAYPSFKGELLAIVVGINKFEHMLQMRKFVLRTDASAMKYLETLKNNRGIFCRWQLYLAEFDFTVQHRAGKSHINADVLSRREDVISPTPEQESLVETMHEMKTPLLQPLQLRELSKSSLKQMTAADPTLVVVMEYVRKGKKPDTGERWKLSHDAKKYINILECLKIQDDLLYFQTPSLNGKPGQTRLCLPDKLRKHAWLSVHSHKHMGITKTAEELSSRFYFHNMISYVTMMNSNCVECIAKQKSYAKSTHVPYRAVYGNFNEVVYTDVMGPIQPSGWFQGRRVNHILTIQDGWTRYLVAIPISDVSTKSIAANFVEHWLHKFSCPLRVHSDNGTGFVSKLMVEIMQLFQIKRTHCPPYTPESNRVERAHKVIGQLIRSSHDGKAGDWVRKLNVAVFVYNTTTNRSIGLSPLEALVGIKPRLPVDLIFRLPAAEQKSSWTMFVDNLKERYYRLYNTITKVANTQVLLDNEKMMPSKQNEIEVGDHVYYYLARNTPHLSAKISVKWVGPLQVIRRVSDSLYVVKPIGDWCKRAREFAAVVNRLRKVDKNRYYEGIPLHKQRQMTLPCLSKNFHEFQEDELFFTTPEAESEVEQPRVLLPPPLISLKNNDTNVEESQEVARTSSDREQSPTDEEGEITSSNASNGANSPPPPQSPLLADNDESVDTNMPRRSTRANMYRGFMSDGTNRRGRQWFRGTRDK